MRTRLDAQDLCEDYFSNKISTLKTGAVQLSGLRGFSVARRPPLLKSADR
jgi:hypothetical protein